MSTPLATFTPSLVDPETLEKLFVAREPVLADLVSRASKAAEGQSLLHRLLIGPRGAGKTHLLSLANHRISHLDPAPTIAWLSEDPWMIDDYADLLREILKASARTAQAVPADLQRLSSEILEEKIRELSGDGGPIVVLAENFDRILETIGVVGQRRLRRLTENDRTLLLLVTATRLTARLLEQDGPFYGFFSTHELAPLSVDEATDMLARVAEHRGDEALAMRLREPRATDRYRLAAVDALAGGQPRIWALLASALTVDGLDSLADMLLTRFDDLTPYYQEQLGRLAPRERKVVRTLADLDQAINVKEIAETLDVDQKSLAKTVSTLRREGWLAEVPIPLGIGDARKTYFELAEPLARLAFQLKNNRGEAIPLLVSFLSTWFSREQLGSPLEQLSDFVRRHLDAAVDADGLHDLVDALGRVSRGTSSTLARRISRSPDPRLDRSLLAFADALASLALGEPAPYLTLPSAQRRVLLSAVEEHGLEKAQRLCIELGSGNEAWIAPSERLADSGAEGIANRLVLADLYRRNDRRDTAAVLLDGVLEECIDRVGPLDPTTLEVRLAQVRTRPELDGSPDTTARMEKLLADCTQVLGATHEITSSALGHTIVEVATSDRNRALMLLDEHLSHRSASGSTEQFELVMRLIVFVVSRVPEDGTAAPRLLDDLLTDAIRVAGPDNLATLFVRQLIADRTVNNGDTDRGLALLTLLAEDQARILGRNHSSTLATLASIGTLSGKAVTLSPVGTIPPPPEDRLVAEPPAPPYGSGTSHNQ